MSMLLLLKEGGSLGIDTIGNLPIDEDIDLLPDTGGAIEPGVSLLLLMKHLGTQASQQEVNNTNNWIHAITFADSTSEQEYGFLYKGL
jgi:hypothetical protein